MRDRVVKPANRVEQVPSCVASIEPTFSQASDIVDDANDLFTKPAPASETSTKETV